MAAKHLSPPSHLMTYFDVEGAKPLKKPVGTLDKECNKHDVKILNTPKYFSLLCLVLQTVLVVTTMRYSRLSSSSSSTSDVSDSDSKDVLYLSTTAVFFSEVIKLLGSFFFVCFENQFNTRKISNDLSHTLIQHPREIFMLVVPSVLYTIQNNLIYVALSNISAATYQVTYQLKILTTAVLSVLLLRKSISATKWVALVGLTVGVTLSQWPSTISSPTMIPAQGNRILGVLCVLLACITSGLAGVYLEKILKMSSLSIWCRNIQLGFFGSLLSLVGIFMKDYNAIKTHGFLQGYSTVVWVVIALQGLGGLIVAAVLKYADNILKCFANAVALVLSYLISIFVLGDSSLQVHFILGCALVIFSSIIYSR